MPISRLTRICASFRVCSNLSVFYLIATLGLTKTDAVNKCSTFGEGWKVTRKTMGAAVCTKGDTSPLDNCHGCDSWRLLVWADGACDRLLPKDCRFNTTKAGNYYCGYAPCEDGDLSTGGAWSKGNKASSIESYWFLPTILIEIFHGK